MKTVCRIMIWDFIALNRKMVEYGKRSTAHYWGSSLIDRKYGTTGPAIVKGRHKPIRFMRQSGM